MVAMSSVAFGATLSKENVVTPDGSSTSYLQLGTYSSGASKDTWNGNLVVGDYVDENGQTVQGDVDRVGIFDANWAFVAVATKITRDFEVKGDVTINGNGKMVVGGKASGSKYTGLTANKVTLNGDGSTVNLESMSTNIQSLELNNAKAYLHMGQRPANGYFFAMESQRKQAIIQNNITINGDKSYLLIGSQGGASTNTDASGKKTYHYATSLGSQQAGLTLTQNGGTVELNGDVVAKSGLNVVQNKGKTTFRDYLSFNGAGKSFITQNGDATNKPTMVIGRLANAQDSKNNVEVDIKQTGGGSIQLKYGTDFAGTGVVNLIQEGSGTITIGGDGTASTMHQWLTSFKSTNTTYNLTQTGTGKININADAAITAEAVNVGKDAILNVNGALTITGASSLLGTVNVGANAIFTFEQTADMEVTTTLSLQEGNTMNFNIGSVDDSNGAMQMGESGDLAFTGGTLTLELSDVAMQEMAAEAHFIGVEYHLTLIDNLSDTDVTELEGIINDSLVLERYYAELATTRAVEQSNVITFESQGLMLEGNQLKAVVLVTNPDKLPEPTTTTLSLMALAALAARRRRK